MKDVFSMHRYLSYKEQTWKVRLYWLTNGRSWFDKRTRQYRDICLTCWIK